MLKLSRRDGERVILHKDNQVIAVIEVEHTAFRKNRLVFYADREIQVDRMEISPDDLRATASKMIQKHTKKHSQKDK